MKKKESVKTRLKKNSNFFIFIFLLVISLLMLTFTSNNTKKRLGHIGYTVSSSVQYGAFSVFSFFKETFSSISELKKLKREYNILKLKFNINQTMLSDYDSLKRENDELRSLLKFSKKLQYDYVISKIVAKDPTNLFSNFSINVGKNKGIKKYMPVIAFRDDGEYGLIGVVSDVAPFTSHVMPLFSNKCYVSSKIDSYNYHGLLSGYSDKANLLKMNYISREAKDYIKIGDLIVTSGENSLYPKGLKIGQIENISYKDWESSISLYVKPFVSFSKLEYIYVLKETK